VSESGVFSGTRLRANFLEANLEHLALPALTLEAVRAARSDVEVCELVRGEPVLRRGDHLLGGMPTDEELAAFVKDEDSTVYVIFGLGLGQAARALRAYTNAPIVIFEPDAGVLRGVLELGPTDLSHFDIVTTRHDLTQIWPTLFAGRQSATIVNTPGYLAAHAEAAADLRATLAELVQRSRINDATHRVRARDWVADVLANVELLGEHPGFLALAGKYQGVPAFIVGAGPSLGKNGHALLQAQKKGIVFAVNSSARALDKLGVEPQVLACMESIDVSPLLRDLSFIDRVVRAFTLTAHPDTARTGTGPMLPLWEGIHQIAQPLKQLTGFDGVPVSGSVSTIAFALAYRLGCSPIVFVGQDLAYTGGRAYAAGTAYEDSKVSLSADGRTIEMQWCDTLKKTHNINGRPMHDSEPLNETTAWGGRGSVLTSIGFSAVRAWLEDAAIVLGREDPERRLVNATEGGAHIHGYEETTLEALLAEFPDCNITAQELAARARAESAPLSLAAIAAWAEHQAAAVAKARHVARRIQRLAGASLRGIKSGSPNVAARLSRLDAAERELSRSVQGAPLLDAWSWPDVDRVMAERKAKVEDAQESAEDALDFEARFGTTIDLSARALERELLALAKNLRLKSASSNHQLPRREAEPQSSAGATDSR
jgi:hypothetical protein